MGHRNLPKRHITFLYVTWTIGTLLIAGFGIANALWQLMIVSFAMQALFTAGLIVWSTLDDKLVPTELLGRVSSFDWLVSVSLIPISFASTWTACERHRSGYDGCCRDSRVLGRSVFPSFAACGTRSVARSYK